MKTVKEIVVDYLVKHGFGGLGNSDGECGCTTNDLFPCSSECVFDCEPRYRIDNPNCKKCVEKCEGYDDGVNCTYCLTAEKPKRSKK